MSSIFWLRGSDLTRRPSGYAYHYSFRYFDESNLLVWTFPSPTPEAFGCLPSSLYTFLDHSRLGSGLPLQASPNLTEVHA